MILVEKNLLREFGSGSMSKCKIVKMSNNFYNYTYIKNFIYFIYNMKYIKNTLTRKKGTLRIYKKFSKFKK